jgi:hypothetical protein
MKSTTRALIAATLIALTAGCQDAAGPATGTTPATPVPERPQTAAETVQEMARLVNVDPDVYSMPDPACALFDQDAYQVVPDELKVEQQEGELLVWPMTKWCWAEYNESFDDRASSDYAGRAATVEEETAQGDEQWVWVSYADRAEYVAAVQEGPDGWVITRWCYHWPSDGTWDQADPYSCLRGAHR